MIEKNRDIHDYEYKTQLYVDKIKSDAGLSEKNRQSLLQYYKEHLPNMSLATQSKNLQVIYMLCKETGFKDLTEPDMEKLKQFFLGMQEKELEAMRPLQNTSEFTEHSTPVYTA